MNYSPYQNQAYQFPNADSVNKASTPVSSAGNTNKAVLLLGGCLAIAVILITCLVTSVVSYNLYQTSITKDRVNHITGEDNSDSEENDEIEQNNQDDHDSPSPSDPSELDICDENYLDSIPVDEITPELLTRILEECLNFDDLDF